MNTKFEFESNYHLAIIARAIKIYRRPHEVPPVLSSVPINKSAWQSKHQSFSQTTEVDNLKWPYLPVFVMIISVPSSLNLSQRSLVSRWQATCFSSSQFDRSWSNGFTTGEAPFPLVLPVSSVSGSSSALIVSGTGGAPRTTPEPLASLSAIHIFTIHEFIIYAICIKEFNKSVKIEFT